MKGLSKIPPSTGDTAVPIDKVLPDITDVGHNDVINWKRIFAQSRAGRHQALLRRARRPEGAARQPEDRLRVSLATAVLTARSRCQGRPSFDLVSRSDYAGVAYKDASGPRKG